MQLNLDETTVGDVRLRDLDGVTIVRHLLYKVKSRKARDAIAYGLFGVIWLIMLVLLIDSVST